MSILKSTKNVIVLTPHEEAADLTAGALGLFHTAISALNEANEILDADTEYAVATIDVLSADVVKNNQAKAQNTAVLSKLNDFLAVPA